MHELDPAFTETRKRAAARRIRRRRNRILTVAVGSLGLVLCIALVATRALWMPLAAPPAASGPEPSAETAAPEPNRADAPAVEQRSVFVPAILDLAGDPLLISIGGSVGSTPRLRDIARPTDLLEPGISERLSFLSDTMLSSSERFMTTLPSSPEDFAFFQAQSARAPGAASGTTADAIVEALPAPEPEPAEPEDPEDDFELTPVQGQDDGGEAAGILAEGEIGSEYEDADPGAVAPGTDLDDEPAASGDLAAQASAPGVPGGDGAAGWGETVTDGARELPGFEKTRIANTTSVGFVIPETDRKPAIEDFLVRVLADRTLDGIVLENGFAPDDAKKAGEALNARMGLEALKAGDVVAMRGYRSGPEQTIAKLVQISVYRGENYIGSLAQGDDGGFATAADAWVKDDLFHYSQDKVSNAPKREYRLLDAIYSTAARNNVPSGVIGELIQLLSRGGIDLQSFATQDDRLILLYSATPRDGQSNTGRVLFAAVKGTERDFRCFAYEARPGAGFVCMQEGDGDAVVTVTNGMVTPVSGVMTSTFGPRKHPILGKVRIHKGVDWAAPSGTPVVAAFDGVVEFAADNGSYGNFVRLKHDAGKETGYAHLDRFAAGMKPGVPVKAGEVIGFLGTTGLSTGPHLHFELYQDGHAVNPLAPVIIAAVAAGSDDEAVTILVNRIIGVESGGNHKAKNPLSSATGLGQFIESTWLRMMRTYRPELARSLGRDELLALRFDPTISREMVANLARESEVKLRSFGHEISAGRLYLAHFLGVDGANRVLSASLASPIEQVVDAGVVPANPFLRGMTAADVINWAERKMRGKAARVVAPTVETRTVSRTPPEFLRYKEAMTKFMQATGAAL